MSIITWTDPICDLTVLDHQKIRMELVRRLQGRIEEAYIFGSFASGKVDHESDIDLIVIKDTREIFLRRPMEFVDLFEVFPRLDIFVYSPEEFKMMMEKPDGFFQGTHLEKLI